jgi:hypothetical protein
VDVGICAQVELRTRFVSQADFYLLGVRRQSIATISAIADIVAIDWREGVSTWLGIQVAATKPKGTLV